MASYIISYDLRKDKDYKKLIAEIKNYGTYAKVLESFWVVVTNDTSEEIKENLSNHMDIDDGLIVVKSANVGSWKKVLCTGQWLVDNL
ncbi:MAG: hypothetical protein ABIM99_01235 [Candidatus Dojkabacteria bacterium]